MNIPNTGVFLKKCETYHEKVEPFCIEIKNFVEEGNQVEKNKRRIRDMQKNRDMSSSWSTRVQS